MWYHVYFLWVFLFLVNLVQIFFCSFPFSQLSCLPVLPTIVPATPFPSTQLLCLILTTWYRSFYIPPCLCDCIQMWIYICKHAGIEVVLARVSAGNRWQLPIKIVQRESNNGIVYKSADRYRKLEGLELYTRAVNIPKTKGRRGGSSCQKKKESPREGAVVSKTVMLSDSAWTPSPDSASDWLSLTGNHWFQRTHWVGPQGWLLRVQIRVEKVGNGCAGE